MSVKLRLQMSGARNRRQFRIVAVDESKKRNGKVIEILGQVNPLVKPQQVTLKKDRIEHFLKHGATPTPTVKNLISQS